MRKIYNKLLRGDPTVIYGVCKKLADLANKKDERFTYIGVIWKHTEPSKKSITIARKKIDLLRT